MSESYHGIPSEKEREAMSVLQLAELLASLQKDTVPYIVLSHELNLKIAKGQAKATLNAGWLGAVATIIAALVTFALGYFIGTSQPKEPNEPKSKSAVAGPASQPNATMATPVPPASAVQTVPPKPLEVRSGDSNTQKTIQPNNAKPKP